MTDQSLPSSVETVVIPRTRDLGGFDVARVLPSAERRMVGPFVFLDRMGPAIFGAGQGIDVRPHPHIGLATVTYLFDGAIVHRDSLGSIQEIRPGDVNWMTAGRGIVHSERTGPDLREKGSGLWGLQSWVALPKQDEETTPAFTHYPVASLPTVEDTGITMRVVAGTAFGKTSQVKTCSELFYVDAILKKGSRLAVEPDYDERAAFISEGEIEIDGHPFDAGRLVVFAPDQQIVVTALRDSRIVVLGGEPLDGPRHLWWNFVSSSNERIEQAKAD